MKRFIFLVISSTILLVSCASIKTYKSIEPKKSDSLKAFVGSKVFSLTVTQDLPNAFGKADVYGGKINKSKSQLVYLGLNENSMPIFNLSEIEYDSNETTMSRYGQTKATATTTKNGQTSTTNITVYQPPKGSTLALPANSFSFVFDHSVSDILDIANVRIQITEISKNYIVYNILRKL